MGCLMLGAACFGDDRDNSARPDAPPQCVGCDADPATPDGGVRPMKLSQTTDDTTIDRGNSRTCNSWSDGEIGTAENHFYRAYRLAEYGITGRFELTSIGFGVERAETGTRQPVFLRVHTYASSSIGVELFERDMEELASVFLEIENDAAGTVVTHPIEATIPPNGTFVIEVSVPDHGDDISQEGTVFYMGSNSAGQTRPAYVKSPCQSTVPMAMDVVGWDDMHTILFARGKAY